MIIKTIKTHKITSKDKDLYQILDAYLPLVKEKSILAVTSKIISICEGRIIKINDAEKELLIKKESEYYLPAKDNRYHVSLTIARNMFVATAGIDESNGNGYYVLWPKDPQKTANNIREYLKKRFNLHKIGVIVTDSKTTPLRWGVTGVALSHSGFSALNNYIGKADIFGRKLEMTKVSVMDGLAAAAVLAMGEGKEQTPIAIIEDISNIAFQKNNPTEKELKELRISMEDDLYAPLLKSVKWEKGLSK